MSISYIFNEQTECNFCKNKTKENKILGMRLNKSQGFNPKKKTGIAVSVIKCKNCNLIYSTPQPAPENIQDHYGIPPENYWKDEYFKFDPTYFSGEIEIAKKHLGFKTGMTALDIGAGIGKCILSLENAGFKATGIEPSIPFREKAISKMKIDPSQIKLGMLEEIEFEPESFDFITFGAVLEHLYDPSEAIEKALKWLKKDGIIQIEVPSSNWLIADLFNIYFKFKRTSFVTNLSPMHEPFHMFEFDLKSFQKLSEKLDFKIVDHNYFNGDIYHIPKILHPMLNWYMRARNKGMQLTVYLKK